MSTTSIVRSSAGRITKSPSGSPVTVAVTAALLPSTSSATPQSAPAGTFVREIVRGPGAPAGIRSPASWPSSHPTTTTTSSCRAAPGPAIDLVTVTVPGFGV